MATNADALRPAHRDDWIMPVPAWRVSLEGQDLTAAIAPRLIQMSLSEKRGEEADTLDIVIGDEDGKMALPPPDATLSVALGWAKGSGVAAGLVDKGLFRVAEVAWGGPPDQLRLTARAADLTAGLRNRRSESWIAQSLSAIVATIAQRNGLTPRVHARLAGIQVAAMRQQAKSDIAFIADIGRRYDAVATVKAGSLILAPAGIGATAAGTPISGVTIERAMCAGGVDYTRKTRDEHDGVEAEWHDQASGQRQTVRVGGTKNARRLKRTYANAGDAQAAAEGARRRDARSGAEVSLTLAHGDARLMPETPVTLAGFKAEIDAAAWLVTDVTHTLGSGGYLTEVTLELANPS